MSRDKDTLPQAGPVSSRRMAGRFKRIVAWSIMVLAVGLVGFAAVAWRPAIREVAPPDPSSFSPVLIQQGAKLAAAGFCASCHSVAGAKPFAGGYAMKTGFGTIYSTNISPDRKTGIGSWSEEAFRRAMREGVARDGSHLFPAFPYDHFTKLSDADVHALYAFVMTREPVHAQNHPNEMPFPFGIRSLQAGWKLLFFHPGRFEPQADQSARWNRGAYLAESLSHCSACHTSRGPLGEELTNRLYQGAAVDGWFAPALTAANPAPVPWTSAELRDYLTTGVSRYHGTAAGPMASVTQELGALDPDDQEALVTYVESLGNGDARAGHVASAVGAALDADAHDRERIGDAGGRLFVSACASCHYNRAPGVNAIRPELGLNSAVYLDDPSNLIRVILYGINAKDGASGIVMPGFARGMTDEDVAKIAAYLRSTRTEKAPWPNLAKQVAAIRHAGPGEIR
ncbi:c-type cytochrome [Paraburkholderia silvatlantica]|uniref:Mono/diheme cytochrome c family protein n=1 Tax=Paraburkholderia silvatlantica TaxID=321895 RepID=A0A2V4TEW7_9BURK|nr:cytochrome c [Paraburkholderia silvatlantica]PYE17237.1 mono/diheme cytochrome c family protein [Paraburkholderia silvatlantica]TDQ81161.1 mono/diheme cytochrome c family protein [Paraburkholderia silvatlantica]